MLEMDLKKFSGGFSGYTELRLQENRNLEVVLLNGNLVTNTELITRGAAARVNENGSWGFASASEAQEETVKYVLETAKKNARFLDSRLKLGQKVFSPRSVSSVADLATKKPRRSRREILDFIQSLDAHILKSCPDLVGRKIWFGALDVEKSVLTSGNASVYSMIPRTRVVVYLSAQKNGAKADVYKILGGCGQFEDVFGDSEWVFREISVLSEHLAKKLQAVAPESGPHECILGPEMCGMLAHEAVGHTAEADHVLAGSVAKDLVGKMVANPKVSICDFANTAFGSTCPAPVYVDDEGVRAEDVEIIKDGVFLSYLHNRMSAEHFGVKPAGNAKAAEFSDEPIIRMRNTAILPGWDVLSEMIASVDDGYYLLVSGNGQADATSEFMFGVQVGYEIKKGKIGRAIADTTVSGVAYDVLRSVSMVSREFSWLNGSMCSKLQRVPVGMGGPSVKCRLNFGGR